MIGKTVSHYKIVGSLGQGGMGVVYSGEDVRLGRPVALKFVPEDLARDSMAIERLNSEARTASGLNHPNICTIYDIGEYEGQPFIVMELLKGQTLRERLEKGPLKIHEVVELGIQVADALDSAHQRAIIHRDIKPANLFLVERGPVKILDFGLAKLLSRRTDISTTAGVTRDRTAEGVTLGTVAYMSPEQVTGEDLDGRTDLFSLGVVLYEALTGHQPFTGKTSAVIFSAILTRAPVAPVVFNPEMPLRLQEVINNCLEKDRELRYPDAAGLRADLRRVKRDLESGHSGVFRLSGTASIGRGDQPGSAPSQVARPHSGSAQAEIGSRSSSGAVDRSSNAGLIGAVAIATAVVVGGTIWVLTRPKAPPPAPSTTSSAPDRTRVALATASLESKDYRAAMRYAEEALRAAPDDRDAARIRDAARGILSRFDDAITQVGQRLAAGDADGATRALDIARSIDPASPVIGDLSARVAALRQAPDRADGVSPKSAALPPSSPQRQQTNPAGRGDAARSRAAAPPAVPSPQAAPPPPPVSDPAASRPLEVPQTARPAPPAVPPSSPPVPPPTEPPAATPPSPTRSDATERRDTPATPARAAESDDAAIRRIVATYARAIETKDLGLFRSVKPNMSPEEQRRVEDGFRAVTSQQVGVTILSIEQRGQEASVRLRRRDTIQAGGRQQTSESLQTMILTRAASGWVIREIGR